MWLCGTYFYSYTFCSNIIQASGPTVFIMFFSHSIVKPIVKKHWFYRTRFPFVQKANEISYIDLCGAKVVQTGYKWWSVTVYDTLLQANPQSWIFRLFTQWKNYTTGDKSIETQSSPTKPPHDIYNTKKSVKHKASFWLCSMCLAYSLEV